MLPFLAPVVLVTLCGGALGADEPPKGSGAPIAHVQTLLPQVSAERIKADIEKLVSFGTRHTLSDTTSPTRGIGAAREWLRSELASYSRSLDANLESFDAPKSVRLPDGATIVNVVAVLPGTSEVARDRAYYVVGHYDSRNGDAMDAKGDAPGANDDASGTAVVLECARVLAKNPCESTIVFLCTAAEEQGLIGAHFHAKDLAANKPYRFVQVLSNDIVGDPGPSLHFDMNASMMKEDQQRTVIRLFSEGIPRNANAQTLATIRSEGAECDSPSRQLARFVAFVAQREQTHIQPMLVFRQDRFLRGGDHSAFNEAGFGAVRFTVPAEDYSRQHQNVTKVDGKPYGDLPAFVEGEYVANVARLNLATLIHMANAPTPPQRARIITAELTTNTTVRWEASPEPDVAGYEVVWRLTTDADWTNVMDAGTTTETTILPSKDNFFFGVRAYDKDGYRSPVSFAWASKE